MIDSIKKIRTEGGDLPISGIADQEYNPESENAQSGKAVAEALGTIVVPKVEDSYNENSSNAQSGIAVAEAINTINFPTVDQTYNPESENAQSGKAVSQAIKAVGSGKYELIETIEFAEDMAINRTEEPDGTPYNFTSVFFQVETTAPSAKAVRWIFRSGTNASVVQWDLPALTNNTGTRRAFIEVFQEKGWWTYRYVDWYQYQGGATHKIPVTLLRFERSVEDYPTINRVYGTTDLPAGTTLKIWGVRA